MTDKFLSGGASRLRAVMSCRGRSCALLCERPTTRAWRCCAPPSARPHPTSTSCPPHRFAGRSAAGRSADRRHGRSAAGRVRRRRRRLSRIRCASVVVETNHPITGRSLSFLNLVYRRGVPSLSLPQASRWYIRSILGIYAALAPCSRWASTYHVPVRCTWRLPPAHSSSPSSAECAALTISAGNSGTCLGA
jgi:hypothetical protein